MSYEYEDLRNERLPEYAQKINAVIIDSLDRYAMSGCPTGGFLRAVLEHDLFEAFHLSDDDNSLLVVILREKGDLVEVLAPIAPDERGTKIPVDNEPAPLALQKSMSCPSFHAAMKIQARAIAEVYRQAGLDIHGKSL